VNELKKRLQKKYLDKVGFTEVFQLLLTSKKVLVGHNCFSDLLFLFKHFNDDLPRELIDFKQVINSTLINVYDTRVIQKDNQFDDILTGVKSLSDLFTKVVDKVDVFYAPNITENSKSSFSFHNAG